MVQSGFKFDCLVTIWCSAMSRNNFQNLNNLIHYRDNSKPGKGKTLKEWPFKSQS